MSRGVIHTDTYNTYPQPHQYQTGSQLNQHEVLYRAYVTNIRIVLTIIMFVLWFTGVVSLDFNIKVKIKPQLNV